ncbi:MAG: hypothetical protein II951_07940 [Bacteroidales bacterium]|nr:hypothetical protein [Bacteroidales bacterium]
MNRILTSLLFTGALASNVNAQMIDLDFASKPSSQVTMENYTPWPIDRKATATLNLENEVTIVLSAEAEGEVVTQEGETVDKLSVNSNWSKNIIQQNSKLIGDCGYACYIDDDGNYKWIKSGSTSLVLTITGMTAGHHTLLGWHSDTDANQKHPDMEVSVDGVVLQTGVKTGSGAKKQSEAGMSVVEFDVTEGQPVVIKWTSKPAEGVEYDRTSVVLNALEFDSNPFAIMDPVPANYEFHVDAQDTKVDFSWVGASLAVKHKLVYGTDSASVADAVEYQYVGSTPAYSAKGFTPLTRYWWRVDEEDASGNVYKGMVMAFQPRRDAFPGAEGYGRWAVGGRGGVVYHVTNLDDNGDDENPIEGSFRYGIKKVRGPRTIVFDVAGVISLKSRLTCSDKFVTIAGQTAPGNGVMLRTCPFGMASDGITRFIRLRLGHKLLIDRDAAEPEYDQSGLGIPHNVASYGDLAGTTDETILGGVDGMGMAGNDHSIMDHCSISWTIDEAFSSRNAKGITLQKTLISETLNQAGHPNYNEGTRHGYSATIGGGNMSVDKAGSYHHNLMAHSEGRNWSMGGGLDGKGDYDGRADMFNNVCYNWGGRTTDGGTHEGQFVGNYYKMGAASSRSEIFIAELEGVGTGTQSYYISGNIRESTSGTKTADKLNNTYKYNKSSNQTLDWEVFVSEPFFPSYAEVETAEAAYKNVLSDVGCNQPFLDYHDQRMVSETKNGTYTTKGSRSGKKGLIDSETDNNCEGFDMEALGIVEAQREADWDTDQDGIPDWFESITGTSKEVANNNADRDGDYYTDLEEYLNWVAEPNFRVAKGETKTIDLSAYFAGYSNPGYSMAAKVDGASVDGDKLVFTAGEAAGLVTVKVTAAENGVTLTRSFNFAVDGVLTSVKRVYAHDEDAPIFNLAGQRLKTYQRGLNIQNGKMILKK